MTQYIVLIQANQTAQSTADEWDKFFTEAQQSGFFKGGSEIGERYVIGDAEGCQSTDHIVGFMRFDSDDRDALMKLLEIHPVVLNGGSVQLCEMPITE